MEGKKKNFLENLRLKTKFGRVKKPGKKELAKQGRNLASRRSISVPDLHLVPGETFSSDSGLLSIESFGVSPRLSDTDSNASSSGADGLHFADRLYETIHETAKLPRDHSAGALGRFSVPNEAITFHDEPDNVKDPGSEGKMNWTPGPLYAQVDKRGQGNVPTFTFDPVPAPRTVTNTQVLSPVPDVVKRESFFGEDRASVSEVLAGVVARAGSLGEQGKPNIERKIQSFEKKKSSSDKGSPPTRRKNALVPSSICLTLDPLGAPLESGEGTSMDSACGTPSEEQANMPWTTDSEEPDREPFSPFMMRQVYTEEASFEAQNEEGLEELEVSFNMHTVFNYRGFKIYLKFTHCRFDI